MCIAILQPAGKLVKKKWLMNSFNNNEDGAGYMFAHNKKIVIKKPFWEFKVFWHAFKADRAKYGKSADFVIHFRIGTSGQLNKRNCHPHRISEEVAYAHNGILSNIDTTKNSSDTVVLAKALKNLPDGWFFSGIHRMLLDQYAKNQTSKFIFMDNLGRSFICNEKAGDWTNGCWYSNMSYLRERVYRTCSTAGFHHRYDQKNGVTYYEREWQTAKRDDAIALPAGTTKAKSAASQAEKVSAMVTESIEATKKAAEEEAKEKYEKTAWQDCDVCGHFYIKKCLTKYEGLNVCFSCKNTLQADATAQAKAKLIEEQEANLQSFWCDKCGSPIDLRCATCSNCDAEILF